MDDSRPPEPSGSIDGHTDTDPPTAESPATTRTRRQTLALAVGVTAATAGCSGVLPARTRAVDTGDWATPGGTPAGTYASDGDASTTADDLRRRFHVETPDLSGSTRGVEPVVHDGTVYVGWHPSPTFDAATGRQRAALGPLDAPPAVTTQTPYRNATLVGVRTVEPSTGPPNYGREQALVGLNPTPSVDDGLRVRWRFPDTGGAFGHWGGDGVSPLTVADGTVFAGGSWQHPDGTQRAGVVALSAADGEPEWTYPVPDDLATDDSPASGDDDRGPDWYPATRPAVRDGTVYAVDALRRVHAVDAATGALEWIQSSTADGALSGRTVVATPSVILLLGDERVVGLDPSDGGELWRQRLDGHLADAGGRFAGAVADGRLIVVVTPEDGSQAVVALDTESGRELWRRQTDALTGLPTVADGRVYLSAYDDIRCLDAGDGRRRWRVLGDEDASPYGTPVPAEGGLYVVGYGSLTAFEREA